mmetsp:Transcript_30074/g.53316  ORF Transcript_30074/g.53316 Transcript_30074/m.53316 type:complete len:279 (-) Transcript_30074:2566-3402(-)
MQFSSVHEQQQITQMSLYYRDIRQLRPGVYEFPIDISGGRLFLQIHIPREFPMLPPMIFVSSPVKHELIGAGQRVLYHEEKYWVPTMPIFEVIRNIHTEFNRTPPRLAKEEAKGKEEVKVREEVKARDLNSILSSMTPSDRAKLADYSYLKKFVDDLPELKAKTAERDQLILSNLELANRSIQKFQASRVSANDEDYNELCNLRDLVNAQKQSAEEVRQKFAPSVMAKVFKSKLVENQQACRELLATLASPDVNITKFSKAFIKLRVENHKLAACLNS